MKYLLWLTIISQFTYFVTLNDKNYSVSNSNKLLLIDSCLLHNIEFNSEFSNFNVQINKKSIALYDNIYCNIYWFDNDGKFLSKQFIHRSTDNKKPLLVETFQSSGDSLLFFLKTLRFYCYDLNGYRFSKVINIVQSDYEIQKKWGANPAFHFYIDRKILILPVSTVPRPLLGNEDRWLELEYYKSPGLFAIYNLKEFWDDSNSTSIDTSLISVSNLIGKRDEIYYDFKFLPHLDLLYWCFDPQNESIYYSESATHAIKQINLSGEIINLLGERGYYLDDYDTIWSLKSFKDTRQEISIQLNHAKLQSPMYEDLFLDSNHLYRLYSKPIDDQTDTLLILSVRINEQGVLFKKKSRFLQVYELNNTNKLLLDVSLPPEFKIDAIIDGIIYANSFFDSASKTFKIYKYVLSK